MNWATLIDRYRTDDLSPYRDVKPNTRADYDFALDRWKAEVGKTTITSTDHLTLRRWQRDMEDAGRSLHYIRAMFTKLRIVTGYGVMLKAPGARDVRDILSEMRFRASKPRTVSPTPDQVHAVIAAADKAGHSAFALGVSLQWWLTLRAVDVRGQWFGTRWADGLTWDMIDGPLIRKAPSKTEKSAPEVMVWDLSPLPQIMARLNAIPKEQRVGPVIKSRTGKPYRRRQWADLWRRFATDAGVPADVWLMDVRAGAINDADRLGATPVQIRNAAGHSDISMTNRYLRERQIDANNVVALRAGAA